MNTNAIAHAPAVPGHGRPDKAETAATATETGVRNTTATAVEITLSEDAQAAMSEDGAPGKSADSPAHRARAMLAEGRVGEDYKNFGQLVSSIARGLDVTGEEGGPDGADDGTAVADQGTGDSETSPVEEASGEDPGEETAESVADPAVDPAANPVLDPAIDPVAVEDELLEVLDDSVSEEA